MSGQGGGGRGGGAVNISAAGGGAVSMGGEAVDGTVGWWPLREVRVPRWCRSASRVTTMDGLRSRQLPDGRHPPGPRLSTHSGEAQHPGPRFSTLRQHPGCRHSPGRRSSVITHPNGGYTYTYILDGAHSKDHSVSSSDGAAYPLVGRRTAPSYSSAGWVSAVTPILISLIVSLNPTVASSRLFSPICAPPFIKGFTDI